MKGGCETVLVPIMASRHKNHVFVMTFATVHSHSNGVLAGTFMSLFLAIFCFYVINMIVRINRLSCF
jgi:hypothetical protein